MKVQKWIYRNWSLSNSLPDKSRLWASAQWYPDPKLQTEKIETYNLPIPPKFYLKSIVWVTPMQWYESYHMTKLPCVTHLIGARLKGFYTLAHLTRHLWKADRDQSMPFTFIPLAEITSSMLQGGGLLKPSHFIYFNISLYQELRASSGHLIILVWSWYCFSISS